MSGYVNRPVRIVTSSVFLTSDAAVASDYAIHVDATNAGGVFSEVLPGAASVAGAAFLIKKMDSSSNAVVITDKSGATIDGLPSLTLSSKSAFVVLLSDGSNYRLIGGTQLFGTPRLLAQSGIASSVTGTTSETTLATIATPANTLGPNGRIRIVCDFAVTGNTDSKVLRVRLNGILLGSTGYTLNTAAATLGILEADVCNQNATNAQYTVTKIITNSGSGVIFPSSSTAAIDMTQAQNITLTGQLGIANSDVITLNRYTVEILNP